MFDADDDTEVDEPTPAAIAAATTRLMEDLNASEDLAFITGGATVQRRDVFAEGNYRIRLVD